MTDLITAGMPDDKSRRRPPNSQQSTIDPIVNNPIPQILRFLNRLLVDPPSCAAPQVHRLAARCPRSGSPATSLIYDRATGSLHFFVVHHSEVLLANALGVAIERYQDICPAE